MFYPHRQFARPANKNASLWMFPVIPRIVVGPVQEGLIPPFFRRASRRAESSPEKSYNTGSSLQRSYTCKSFQFRRLSTNSTKRRSGLWPNQKRFGSAKRIIAVICTTRIKATGRGKYPRGSSLKICPILGVALSAAAQKNASAHSQELVPIKK